MDKSLCDKWCDKCGGLSKILLVLGIILALFVGAKTISEVKKMGYIGKSDYAANTISVSGKGEIIVVPDIATFTFTVTEEASSVADAQQKATSKMNAILDYVKEQGVIDTDIKTSSYNIYPRYEYREIRAAGSLISTSGSRYLAAYVVSQSIEIKVRDLSKAGTLLSGVGQFGATDISSLNFSVDKKDEILRQAREEAIKDAREQAQVLAKSLGVRLGKISNFYEQGANDYYYARAEMSAMGMGGDMMKNAPSTPLPTGENKIISNVNITYEIK